MRRSLMLAVVVVLVAAACGTAEDDEPLVEAEAEPQRTTASVNWHPQSEREGEVEGATAALETTESAATLCPESTSLDTSRAI